MVFDAEQRKEFFITVLTWSILLLAGIQILNLTAAQENKYLLQHMAAGFLIFDSLIVISLSTGIAIAHIIK